MRRRNLLRASGLTIAAVVAGCSAFGGGSGDSGNDERAEKLEETIDAKKATIDSQQAKLDERQRTVDQLNGELSRKEEHISALESETRTNDQRISTLKSDVRRLKKEKVSELYALGYSLFESGRTSLENGRSSESSGNYGIAEGNYAIAHGNYRGAVDAFSRAETLAGRTGLSNSVLDPIESSVSATNDYAKAALNYANEVLFRNKGDTSRANSYESTADGAYAKAQRTTVLTSKKFDSRLGL